MCWQRLDVWRTECVGQKSRCCSDDPLCAILTRRHDWYCCKLFFILRKTGCEGAVCLLLWWRGIRIAPIVLGLRHISPATQVLPQRERRRRRLAPFHKKANHKIDHDHNDYDLDHSPNCHPAALLTVPNCPTDPPAAKRRGSSIGPRTPFRISGSRGCKWQCSRYTPDHFGPSAIEDERILSES
jgi:hypothetical protein